MKTKFLGLTLTAATLVLTGCPDTTTTNTNTNIRNANANNSNVYVVNNNSNMVSNTNRWSNTNISREEYDKNRAEYEKDKRDSKIGTGANDSWIWFKTRAALLTTSGIRESTINVDVENAVVTLRGTVENKTESEAAEKVAKNIDGVTKVNNQLKVAPGDSVTNVSVNSAVNGNGKTTNTDKK